MSLSIVVTGDKHLDLQTEGIPRREEQIAILEMCAKLAADARVYVDLGDLFDTARPTSTATADALQYASDVANDESLESYFLVGNHDRPTRGTATALHYLDKAKLVNVVFVPQVVTVNGFDLLFLPHVTEDLAKSIESTSAQAWLDSWAELALARKPKLPMIVFAHLEAPGISAIPSDTRQRETGLSVPKSLIESKCVKRVYIGHIHNHQTVGKIMAVGSANHVDFKEGNEGQKFAVCATFEDDGSFTEKMIPLPAAPAHIVKVDIPKDWDGHTITLSGSTVENSMVKPIVTVPESVIADQRPIAQLVMQRCRDLGATIVKRPEIRVIRLRDTTEKHQHRTTASLEESIDLFSKETKASQDAAELALDIAREADHGGQA